MALSEIIDVNISIQRAAVTAAGFGIPLILGTHTRFAERYRIYNDLAGMTADGFLTSDAEYQAAEDLLAGAIVPDSFVVGKRLTPVAQSQVITLPADPTDTVAYPITINGVVISTAVLDGTSTTAELQAALVTAINGSAEAPRVTAANSGADVIVTSDLAGTPFTIALGTQPAAPMTLGAAVANHGVQEDMNDIRAAGAAWYGTMQTSRVVTDIALLSAWTETHAQPPSIFMAQSSEATSGSVAVDIAGTDIANVLHTLVRRRTALWWHSLNAEYLDAGILGRELPVEPGSDFWGLKTVANITPDSLSATYKANLIGTNPGEGKNANIYQALTDQNFITSRGTMSSGDWIDNIRFVDFLTARISEAIANLMLSVERVNFDEQGLELIAAQVKGVLQAAKDAHKISSFVVNVPDIGDYTPAARAARQLDPPITFTAQLSGALYGVEINGTVTE